MTQHQRRLLQFVRSYIAEHGASPSYLEIAAGIGAASKGTVFRLVNALIEAGHLRKERHGARSLVVTDASVDLSKFKTSELIAELGRRAHG